MFKPLAAAALAIAAMASTASPAAAQTTYCGGQFVADSFYSTVTAGPNGHSLVRYVMQLRNARGSAGNVTISFTAPGVNGLSQDRRTLSGNASATITLGHQGFSNPSGSGRLSNGAIGRYVVLQCG